MTDKSVQQSALAATALAFPLLNLSVFRSWTNGLSMQPIVQDFISMILGAISIYTLYSLFSWGLYLFAARKFIGIWPYISDGGNCAIANIQATPSGIHYNVDLYRDKHQVYDILDGASNMPGFSQAKDIMSKLDGNELTFTYSIDNKHKDFAPRKGILRLIAGTVQNGSMIGHWESTVDDNTAKRNGQLELYKPEKFKEKINREYRKNKQ